MASLPTTTDTIYSVIVTSFESDSHPSTTAHLIATLPADVTAELLANLHKPPAHIRPLVLIRALWTAPSLRNAILVAFAELAAARNSDNLLFDDDNHIDRQLLDEIGFLIAGDARDESKSLDQRLLVVSRTATAICKKMAVKTSPYHTALLTFAANAAAVIATAPAFQMQNSIIAYLLLDLQALPDAHLDVRAITAVLRSELVLKDFHHTILLKVIERYALSTCRHTAVVPLCRALLTYVTTTCPKSSVERFLLIILHLLPKANEDVLTDLLVVLEIFVLDHPDMLPYFVRVFSQLVEAAPSHPLSIRGDYPIRASSAHIVVLFALVNVASKDTIRIALQTVLERLLTDDVMFDMSNMPSSASTPVDPASCKHAAYTACIKHPAMAHRCDVVLQFFEIIMWRSNVLRKYAIDFFFEAFVSIPNSRGNIVTRIFTCLVEVEASPSVISAFATLFEKLTASKHTVFGLVHCKSILSQAVQSLSFIPVAIAVRVVPAFVSVACLIPSLISPVLIFLRKYSASRAQAHQRIASAGYVSVLLHDRVSDEIVKETCDILAVTLDIAQLPVRCSLLRRLLHATTRRQFPFHRVKCLNERVMNRLLLDHQAQVLNGEDEGNTVASSVDLTAFFIEVDGELDIRDPVPLLLRYCAAVRHDCPEANVIFSRFLVYVGDVNGGIADALSSTKSRASILSRISLLCSIIQTICCLPDTSGMGASTSSASTSLMTCISQKMLYIYGVSLVVRDFLQRRDNGAGGLGLVDGSCWEFGRSARKVRLTAREAKHLRNDNERVVEDESIAEIPMHLWIFAIQRVDRMGGQGVLLQTVRSELMDRARCALERISDDDTRTGNSNSCEGLEWRGALLGSVSEAFVKTCPWGEPEEGGTLEGWDACKAGNDLTKDGSGDGEMPACSMSTAVTMNESQCSGEKDTIDGEAAISISRNKSTACGEVVTMMNDIEFMKSLQVDNIEVSKAMCPTQIHKLQESVRLSVRESCLKILLMLLSKRMIDNEWQFLLSLFRRCVQNSGNEPNLESEKEKVGSNSSTVMKEPDCIVVIKAVAKIFRLEFARSMSVKLTVCYLELMYFLLERIDDEGQAGTELVKKEISSTLMGILREYSVQNSSLLRQMVQVLLISFGEIPRLEFGVRVLDWLGNHAILFDSKYSGSDDDEPYKRHCHIPGFDDDILAEALLLEGEIQLDDEDVDQNSNNGGDEDNGLNEIGDNGNDAPVDSEGNGCTRSNSRVKEQVLDPVRSLCLDETTEGSIGSICCVFSLFHNVVSKASRQINAWMRNDPNNNAMSDKSMQEALTHINEVVKGMLAFVKGEFVKGSLAGFSTGNGGTRKRVRKSNLAWPMELERKVGTLILDLMNVVDVALRLLLSSISGEQRKGGHQASVLECCLQGLRMLYQEDNTMILLSCMQEEWSKRWTLDEQIENTATMLVKRWNNHKPKDEKESESTDGFKIVIDLINRFIFYSSDKPATEKIRQRDVLWRRLTDLDPGGKAEVDNRDDGGERRALPVGKRHRNFRSRNAFIDQYLYGEQESFVDLEGFVVADDEEPRRKLRKLL